MTRAYAFQTTAITSDELEMLHGTLAKFCGEKRIEISHPDAERAAAELIDWFQFGLQNEDQLIEMLRRG